MDFKDYWLTVRRRWRLIAAVTVLGLAVAALLTWQTTPQYASTTRLFVSTSESDSSAAYTGNLFASQRVTSYADLVGSRELAERVADRIDPGAGDATLAELAGQVTAVVSPETVILEITATDADPDRAADIAQAYAEELALLVDELETPRGERDAAIKATLVDDAQRATDPISPLPMRNLALGGVLGLLLGLAIAVARDLLDTSLKTSDDVAEVTPAPVLGHILNDSLAKAEPHEVAPLNSPWSESFRVLRTNMQYVEVDEAQKVFVVTSPLPGEGKSTVAVNLAMTLSQTSQRVVLVECDLRRPSIAPRLGLDGALGTTSVLIGKIDLADALQTYDGTGLRVLTSGPNPPNPSELLQSQAMRRMLAELRSEFDVVVLDAPPLLPVTDAALLAIQTDGALVVTRHGSTSKEQLAHALDRLDQVDAKILGIVLNRTSSRRSKGGYGYGYGYGEPVDEPSPTPSRSRSLAGHRT